MKSIDIGRLEATIRQNRRFVPPNLATAAPIMFSFLRRRSSLLLDPLDSRPIEMRGFQVEQLTIYIIMKYTKIMSLVIRLSNA